MKQTNPKTAREADAPRAPAAAGRLPAKSPVAFRNGNTRGAGNAGGQAAAPGTGSRATAGGRVRSASKSPPRVAAPAEFPDIPSLGDQLRESLAELQAASGAAAGHCPVISRRVVEVKEPGAYNAAAVRDLRRTLNVSQSVFALLVGVSPELVQGWEQGLRPPNRMARRLLDLIGQDPTAFVGRLYSRQTPSPVAGRFAGMSLSGRGSKAS